jgi:hypothetical protein
MQKLKMFDKLKCCCFVLWKLSVFEKLLRHHRASDLSPSFHQSCIIGGSMLADNRRVGSSDEACSHHTTKATKLTAKAHHRGNYREVLSELHAKAPHCLRLSANAWQLIILHFIRCCCKHAHCTQQWKLLVAAAWQRETSAHAGGHALASQL